jgi:hypothetical protein
MNASPKPVRPQRRFEVYEFEFSGRVVQLACTEVDAASGRAIVDGCPITIQWREAANA